MTTARALGLLLLSGALAMGAESKTKTPVKVADQLLGKTPYRFNGVVKSDTIRGSGFCAWNKRTFFSAAHLVFDSKTGEWMEPPVWYPRANSLELPKDKKIQSRGYFRWSSYQDYAFGEELLDPNKAFGSDVIIGFAFKDLIAGTPAKLNLNGYNDLKSGSKSLMTGYPSRIAYTNRKIEGFFMYQTGPTFRTYQALEDGAVEATLISTGPGNSGGPIWTPSGAASWAASGVVVGGLPSESVIYAFSNETDTLLRAVEPVVNPGGPQSVDTASVSSSSRFFSDRMTRQLPDGVHEWTDVPLKVNGFAPDATVKTVKLSVKVKTPHRGDLQILLTGPGGFQTWIHNEQGAGTRDLAIQFKDVSEDFLDIPVEGVWTVRFQDRLEGDLATVQSVVLEIEAKEVAPAGGGTDP